MPSRGCKLPIAAGVINFSAIRSVPLSTSLARAKRPTLRTESSLLYSTAMSQRRYPFGWTIWDTRFGGIKSYCISLFFFPLSPSACNGNIALPGREKKYVPSTRTQFRVNQTSLAARERTPYPHLNALFTANIFKQPRSLYTTHFASSRSARIYIYFPELPLSMREDPCASCS